MKKTTEQKIAFYLKKLIEEVEKNGVNLDSTVKGGERHKYLCVFEFKDSWIIGGHHENYDLKKEAKK